MIQEIEIRNEADIHLHRDILTTKDSLPHVGGYIRTATTDVVGNYSPDMQRSAIRDFCGRKFPEGCRLFWISDIGASGLLPWKHDNLETGEYRTGLTIIMDLMKQGLVQNVCAYSIDRLARSAKVFIEFIEEYIKPLGISLYSVTEMTDDDEDAHFRLSMIAAHSWPSRKNTAADGQHARILDGYTVGKPPYGWISEDKRMLRRSQRIGIEPVAAEAEIVCQIVNECLEGHSLSHIAKGLTSSNVVSPGGTCMWYAKTVKNILCCPVHYGLVKSVDGVLVHGAHFEKRLFDESVYEQVVSKINPKG